jgi:hypothetical protein
MYLSRCTYGSGNEYTRVSGSLYYNGREYEVPVLLNRDIPALKEIESRIKLTSRDIEADNVYQANP